MNFPLYIAKRYLKSVSKNNAINIINRIASLGIITGAAALFIVLSVFSGLVDFSLSFSNTIDPDIKAVAATGKSFFISAKQQRELQNEKGIASFSKIIEERMLFVFDEKSEFTYIKGVDSLFTNVSTVRKSVVNGSWLEPNTNQAVIGYGLYEKLGVGLGEYNRQLEIYAPKPGKGIIENPEEAFRKTSVIPVGMYAISEELDSKYVFTDFELASELMGYKPGQVTALELKLKSAEDEVAVIQSLHKIFGNQLLIRNRAQLNDSLYKMLRTENLAIYLIFTLVIILILFAFAGAIIMMILDKKSNLKTLFYLGAEIRDLRKIFLLQGTLLCVKGGLIGIVIGSIVVVVQQYSKLVMITDTLAYPVVFSLTNIAIVMATIISLGFLASLIASGRVSKKLME
ncbi:ABC transporter permease [Flavobacterium pallidum]|uniref:ABC transporter permease n=1 Tax=Flavobacterium pallidum TaxID=2172098 RepID=A0A2S1SFH9_9FLAO|nr:FtsX-like permease family protein [Flavobacterium pallidum]AWI25121.1 ABC transporter permease [Flavobacterium pallidum]